MDAESEAMTELANRLRQPFYRWHTVCLRTLRATLDGRFDDAELSAREALELGRLRQSEYASYVFRYAQMFAIRWAQGRLQELWPAVEDGTDEFHAERFPWIPRWRDALAAAELGREDAARRELVRHAVRDFSDLPRDGLWLLHVCALAEVAVLVGDRERAGVLYELLLPHAEDNAVSYTQQPFGPVALRLGKLAALLGRWREVDRHFAAALARSELLGARAIRARILLEHARALSARGEPADRRRREAMIDEARGLCEEVGAPALFERFEFAVASRGREPALFRRDGDVWTIAYAAHSFSIRDVKGLGYIAALLERPGRELHVLELAGARIDGDRIRRARAEQTSVWPAEGAALLDDRAKDAYRARLVELEEDLDEARRWGDPERAAGAAEEIDALQQELARAAGFGGRDRAFASPAERARVSVTKAIRTAIRLVERHCPELARHLDESIQTGRFCSYAPPGAEPPTWLL
jgi:hypothetical protein